MCVCVCVCVYVCVCVCVRGGGGGLPTDTQSILLAQLRATITIMDELCKQRSKLINAWLSSYCCLVSFVARNVLFRIRMASPL